MLRISATVFVSTKRMRRNVSMRTGGHPMAEQRVAVVTGASRGIGRAIATTLAAAGQAVVVGYGGAQAAAEEVVEQITAADGRAVAASADVADEKAVAALFDTATEV